MEIMYMKLDTTMKLYITIFVSHAKICSLPPSLTYVLWILLQLLDTFHVLDRKQPSYFLSQTFVEWAQGLSVHDIVDYLVQSKEQNPA